MLSFSQFFFFFSFKSFFFFQRSGLSAKRSCSAAILQRSDLAAKRSCSAAVFSLSAQRSLLLQQVMRSLLSDYFGQPAEDKSRTNLAVSYHIREAVSGLYPDFEMDYAKTILTKGELLGLEALQASLQAGAKVTFDWTDNADHDQAPFVKKKRGFWFLQAAAFCIFTFALLYCN